MPRRAKEIIETRVQIKGNPETRRDLTDNRLYPRMIDR